MSTCDVLGSTTYRTTYKECYQHNNSLPPILYHQQPAIEFMNTSVLQQCKPLAPRKFPVIPAGPRRRRTLGKPPLGPGLGTPELDTEKFIGKKPIVQTEPPFLRTHDMPSGGEEVKLPTTRPERLNALVDQRLRIPREVLDRICKHVTLLSTTRKFTEEAALPVPKFDVPNHTWEVNADMVKLRPKKYEENAEQWQCVAESWDKLQVRSPTGHGRSCQETDEDNKASTNAFRPEKLLKKRASRYGSSYTGYDVGQLAKEERLTTPYVLQTPGYAGFLPRSPTDVVEKKQDPKFTSLMKDSYKCFPTEEYQIQTFHHKGPLSRTVTLTYPYNPFNKLEK